MEGKTAPDRQPLTTGVPPSAGFIVLGLLFLLCGCGASAASQDTSKRHAHPAATGTSSLVTSKGPQKPAPSWHFDALSTSTGRLFLILSNHGSSPADARVVIGNALRHVRIPPGGSKEIDLSTEGRQQAPTTIASKSIVEQLAVLPTVDGEVFLTLTNPNRLPVDARVTVAGHARHVHIAAASETEMALGPREGAQSISVTASAPILSSRLVIHRHTAEPSFGTPGMSGLAPKPFAHLPPPVAQTWHFAALSGTADRVVLTLFNPNDIAVDVSVRATGTVTRVQIPAGGGSETDFPPGHGRQALSVSASAPILPARLIYRSQVLRITYGTPQAVTAIPSPPPATPTPTPPHAARTWQFRGLAAKADQVVLVFSNRNSFPVDLRIRMAGGSKHVRIPAASGAEMALAPPDAAQALTVVASGPIVPSRLVMRHHSTQLSYGSPVSPGGSKTKK